MNDQKITPEKKQEFIEAFQIFDKNNDGYIPTNELEEIMNLLGHSPGEEEWEDMKKEIDFTGTGSIDIHDFLGFMERKMRETQPEEELVEAFNIFDKDKNGLISASEWEALFISLGISVKTDEVEELIKEHDWDWDGYINYEEFVKMIVQK